MRKRGGQLSLVRAEDSVVFIFLLGMLKNSVALWRKGSDSLRCLGQRIRPPL